MPDPLITLVVPTYNRATFLPATLKSLQEQEFRDYEIIIVDDGSTDNTEEVVQPFLNGYTRYVKKDNAERAVARNYGAKLANGRYVNFFDSDDLALPNHTAEAAKIISEKNDPEWFHLGYEWITKSGRFIKKINQFLRPILNGELVHGNCLSCNGVFIRKDIIITHPFNEDRILSASEDYELWLRLASRYPLYYSNQITSQIVDHDQRSVRVINGQKLIDRLQKFIFHLNSDPLVGQYYGERYKLIKMDAWSYIALHLADQPEWKIKSLQYLLQAFWQSPKLLLTKRCYATLKNWILKW